MRIYIDFAASFLRKMCLVIYDFYSKWLDVIPMTNRTLSAVIDHLRWNIISYSLFMEYQISQSVQINFHLQVKGSM